jgi:hypothetical protein
MPPILIVKQCSSCENCHLLPIPNSDDYFCYNCSELTNKKHNSNMRLLKKARCTSWYSPRYYADRIMSHIERQHNITVPNKKNIASVINTISRSLIVHRQIKYLPSYRYMIHRILSEEFNESEFANKYFPVTRNLKKRSYYSECYEFMISRNQNEIGFSMSSTNTSFST